MAEAIGVASGLVALATFACQSSVILYKSVASFQSHQQRVRDLAEESGALAEVLKSLVNTARTNPDLRIPALAIPLKRCAKACEEFILEIKKLSSRSAVGSRTSFRDWARLRYMGEDIDSFARLLSGYRMTISIALTNASLRSLTMTGGEKTRYQALLNAGRDNLEGRLEVLNEKIEVLLDESIAEQSSAQSGTVVDSYERQRREETRDPTISRSIGLHHMIAKPKTAIPLCPDTEPIRDLAFSQPSGYTHVKYVDSGAYADVDQVKSGVCFYAQKTYKSKRGLERARESFQREVNVLQKLKAAGSQNVVQLHDAFTQNNRSEFFLILKPFAVQGTLQKRFEDYAHGSYKLQPLDYSFLANAVLGLASGLAFIHKCQIRHKDICPDNILIHTEEVLFTDFGISVDWCDSRSSTTASYNPPYHYYHAAPELVNKPQKPRNHKSDVFSLGAIYFDLIYLATNSSQLLPHTIWGGSGGYGDCQNVCHLGLIEGYAGMLGCICSGMIQEQRDARPSSAEVLERVLQYLQPILRDKSPQCAFD